MLLFPSPRYSNRYKRVEDKERRSDNKRMIRNLDYWQVASAATVSPAPPPVAKTPTTTIELVNHNSNKGDAVNVNNNEEDFGDRNGPSPMEVCRKSTVIVTMAHDRGERIEVVTSEEGLLEEDDLIDEEPEMEEEVIKEDHEETETKALDASLYEEEEEMAGDEEEEVILEEITPVTTPKSKSVQKKTPNNNKSTTTTSGSSSNNTSFEDHATATSSVGSTPSPDHHARRPMNAFLIFCKRHRPIVREKYPNLENR